jgi:hypothetical protein
VDLRSNGIIVETIFSTGHFSRPCADVMPQWARCIHLGEVVAAGIYWRSEKDHMHHILLTIDSCTVMLSKIIHLNRFLVTTGCILM